MTIPGIEDLTKEQVAAAAEVAVLQLRLQVAEHAQHRLRAEAQLLSIELARAQAHAAEVLPPPAGAAPEPS